MKIARSRALGFPIFGETLHQYLLYTAEDYKRPGGQMYHTYPSLSLAAVLPRGGARPIGGRDRPLDDPLAGGSRFHGTHRGMARRPALSGRHSRRDWFGRVEPGPRSGGFPGSARGGIANRLVGGDLRRRVRLLPIPNNRTILAGAPRERAGSASGILATARLVGQTLGAALVGLIFALTSAGPGGIGRCATLPLLVGAGFAAAGAVVSSLRLLRFRQAEPEPPR